MTNFSAKMKALLKILILLAVLFFCLSATTSAQGNMLDDIKKSYETSLIYPDGTVCFADNDSVRKAIPFAMVSVYDHEGSGELTYVSMSDRFGHFSIERYDYTKAFTYVIEAPGFIADTFVIKKLPTTRWWDDNGPLQGNVSHTFKLKKAEDGQLPKPYTMRAYKADDVKITSDAGGWEGLLRSVPGLRFEDGELLTVNGEPVRVKLNDAEVPAEVRRHFASFPCFMLSEVELYTLPAGGRYGAVVNLVGAIGKRVTKNFNGYAVFYGH